jgi:hypothetical protein
VYITEAGLPIWERRRRRSKIYKHKQISRIFYCPYMTTSCGLWTSGKVSHFNWFKYASFRSPQILKGGQVATVQMFIQLPGGQTIPVSIPAAIADPQTSTSQLVTNNETTEVTVTTATSSSALTKQVGFYFWRGSTLYLQRFPAEYLAVSVGHKLLSRTPY